MRWEREWIARSTLALPDMTIATKPPKPKDDAEKLAWDELWKVLKPYQQRDLIMNGAFNVRGENGRLYRIHRLTMSVAHRLNSPRTAKGEYIGCTCRNCVETPDYRYTHNNVMNDKGEMLGAWPVSYNTYPEADVLLAQKLLLESAIRRWSRSEPCVSIRLADQPGDYGGLI